MNTNYNDNALLQTFTFINAFIKCNDVGCNINVI